MFIFTSLILNHCMPSFNKLELSKQYICGLLYDFKSNESAAASSHCINPAFENGMVFECTVEDKFRHFCNAMQWQLQS